MYNLPKFLFTFIVILLCTIPAMAEQPNNIALHKPYTFSVVPNYSLTRDIGDKEQLTDGKYIKNLKRGFWTRKSVVGWVGNHGFDSRGPVAITIDLRKNQPISGVSFHTAAGKSGVVFPLSIAVLVSNDGHKFHLVGDLTRISDNTPPPYGDYTLWDYKTNSLHTHGRYIRFVVVPASAFIFCDEIEVYRGKSSWLNQPLKGKIIENNKQLVEPARLTALGIYRRVSEDFNTVKQLAGKQGIRRLLIGDFDSIKKSIKSLPTQVDAKGYKAIIPVNRVDTKVFATYAKVLSHKGLAPLTVWHTDPYQRLKPFTTPRGQLSQLNILLMKNERRSEVFNITNTSSDPKTIKFSINDLPKGINPSYVKPMLAEFVDTREGRPFAFALKPMKIKNGYYTTTIVPGMTRQVWLSFEPKNVKAGNYHGELEVSSSKGFSQKIVLSLHIANVRMSNNFALPTLMWDYTFGNSHYGLITENNYKEVRNFIIGQGVVNPVATTTGPVPKRNDFDNRGNLVKKINFSKWDAFVKFWGLNKTFLAFLLHVRHHPEFAGFKPGTTEFKHAMADWSQAWAKHNESIGIKPGQVIVYFLDEPHNEHEMKLTAEFGNAFRSGTKNIRLFTDLNAQLIKLKNISTYVKSYDILCPTIQDYSRLNSKQKALYQKLVDQEKHLWFYQCLGPTRGFDASYFRLLPWHAMSANAVGQGIWSFSDGNGWNPYVRMRETYSPVIIGNNSVTDTKQWEALREGVEDYQYFYMIKSCLKSLKANGNHSAKLNEAQQIINSLPKKLLHAVIQRYGTKYYYNAQANVSIYAKKGRLSLLSVLEELPR